MVAVPFSAGPFVLADTLVTVTTDDRDFAVAVEWCFRDLQPGADQPMPWTGPESVFEIRAPIADAGRWAMWQDGIPCELSLAEDYVLFHLQWEFNRVVLERSQLTIHAAAVEIEGRAYIFPASSMSGKTTLAGWMSVHGAGYVADEIVALDRQLRAASYRRPLGLRHGGPLEQFLVADVPVQPRFEAYEMLTPVSGLGATSFPVGPWPVAGIVFPKYEVGAATTITPLTRSVALERLCESAPGLARHGRMVFTQLAAMARKVPTVSLSLSDLPEADRALREWAAANQVAA